MYATPFTLFTSRLFFRTPTLTSVSKPQLQLLNPNS